ncbi:MAG: serine protease, partial [Cyanobacteriota bacterium]|nr:serine protease [Cyanobacteriota bacterium]
LEVRGLPADIQPLPLTTGAPSGILKVVGHPADKPPWTVATFSVLKSTERELLLDGMLKPGASGSPVLNASGQVLGLVYEISTFEKKDINFVFAYRSSAIQSKLP